MALKSPAFQGSTVVGHASDKNGLIGLAAEIVCAYVGNNAVASDDLPRLIGSVYDALAALTGEAVEGRPEPAVPIRQSVTDDYIVCLEDGQKFQSLKRHLRAHYDMSPDDYRQKWGLPGDYPMVAPNYAHRRSALAKRMGLGKERLRRKSG